MLPICSSQHLVVWVHASKLTVPPKGRPGPTLPGIAITRFAMQVYARQVRCLFCGCEGAQLEGHPMRCCVGRQQQPELCEEDLSCRQCMPVSPHHLQPGYCKISALGSVCTCLVTLVMSNNYETAVLAPGNTCHRECQGTTVMGCACVLDHNSIGGVL